MKQDKFATLTEKREKLLKERNELSDKLYGLKQDANSGDFRGVRELNEKGPQINKQISELSSQIKEVSSELERLGGNEVKEPSSNVSTKKIQTESDISTLTEQHKELNKKYQELSSKLYEMEDNSKVSSRGYSEYKTQKPIIEKQISELSSQINKLDRGLKSLGVDVKELSSDNKAQTESDISTSKEPSSTSSTNKKQIESDRTNQIPRDPLAELEKELQKHRIKITDTDKVSIPSIHEKQPSGKSTDKEGSQFNLSSIIRALYRPLERLIDLITSCFQPSSTMEERYTTLQANKDGQPSLKIEGLKEQNNPSSLGNVSHQDGNSLSSNRTSAVDRLKSQRTEGVPNDQTLNTRV